MKTWMYFPVLFGAAAFVGCTQSPQATETTTDEQTTTVSTFNDHCPIMGGEVTAEGGVTEWDGKTIGFCCPGCIDKFKALSDEEKTQALAEAEESADGQDHADHDHEAAEKS